MRSDKTAQATAHQLVNCVLDSDSDGLTDALETVVVQGDRFAGYVREVVAELLQVAATSVRDTTGPTIASTAFTVDLRDDAGDPVAIDELVPQARATVRALLADLNGSPEDARFQLDLAVREMDPLTGLDTVRRALTMTVALIRWTGEEDR